MINDSIKKLVTYGLEKGLIEPSDKVWATNRLLEALSLDEYDEPKEEYKDIDLENTLAELLKKYTILATTIISIAATFVFWSGLR